MQGYCGSLSKLLVTLHLMAFQHSSLDQLTPGRKPEINHGDEQFRAVGLYRDLFRTCEFTRKHLGPGLAPNRNPRSQHLAAISKFVLSQYFFPFVPVPIPTSSLCGPVYYSPPIESIRSADEQVGIWSSAHFIIRTLQMLLNVLSRGTCRQL